MKVSEVSVGGWLTHGRTLAGDETEGIVKRAFELGVNFFDTADVYHCGAAETALGVAVRGMRREDLVIATKCFFPMSDGVNDRGNGRKHIFESVHSSLKRLGTDYLDLMQFHRFDEETPLEETVRAIDDLVRQGKVMYWGVSMWPAWAITDVCQIAKAYGCTKPVSNQPVYNLLERGIESSVVPACEKHGLSQVVFSPLAQGVLTGKYKPGEKPPKGTRAADDKSNMFMDRYLHDDVLRRVRLLESLAKEAGLTMGQFSLAWCLRLANVASVIVGATSIKQIEENATASGAIVDPKLFEAAEEILAE